MGLIRVDLFVTLDGVAQAPGGPQEDLEGGFGFGGWQAPLVDETVGQWVTANLRDLDALLLGRRTYDIFAAYWPHVRGPDDSIAGLFNRVPKYVASRTRGLAPTWRNSSQLGADLDQAVQALRDRHEHIHVIGSLNLVQTLFSRRLVDELTLWVHPVVLGNGKRAFDPGDIAASLRLIEPAQTSPRGIVQLRYEVAEGVPGTGDMSQHDAPSPGQR